MVGEEVDCCVAASAVVASEVVVEFASSVLVVMGPFVVVDVETVVVSAALLDLIP